MARPCPHRAIRTSWVMRYLCCWVCLLVALFVNVVGSEFESQELKEIRGILKRLNKPAIKSIQSPDGDIIDCVSIRKQLAFDHPLLQQSKLQMSPSNVLRSQSKSLETIRQLWHQTGQQCPNGTIPTRRTLEADIRRLPQSQRYGCKSHGPPRGNASSSPPAAAPSANQHEHAIAYVNGVFFGAQATINVWDPSVEIVEEFSLSQMWVLSGTFSSDLNSAEAGWQVSPALYGDMNPRFFTYWTSDSYRTTGCYNLLCAGFVQISNAVVLGGSLAPISSVHGAQYDIRILIFKDSVTGNWWLSYGSELIGYWPTALFTHLASFATLIEWGGEVVNSQPDNRHTATQMGSGKFAQAGYAEASYLKDLHVVDFTGLLRVPNNILTFSTKPDCYDVQKSSAAIFYGGPGLSSSCH